MEKFGGSSIDESLFNWILKNLDKGKTILELGSGNGSTGELSKYYNMISIEDDLNWIGKYKSYYIWAPLSGSSETSWYDVEKIENHLKGRKYDLLLVDGPVGSVTRVRFMDHLDLFDLTVPIVIDDIKRKPELEMLNSLSKKLDREKIINENWGAIL